MMVTRRGDIWSLHTPAKLNLHLEVLGRRSDGYHNLETLMVPISIFDSLTFESIPENEHAESKLLINCGWAPGLATQAETLYRQFPECDPFIGPVDAMLGALPAGEHNLVTRAVQLIRRDSGIKHGARVTVSKRIPSAAGLGGASSDAAAALRLANAAWRINAPRDQLRSWAAQLGSDVPFFIDTVPAICRSRGEEMEPTGNLPSMPVVVARPPVGLSTPEVFKLCRPSESPVAATEVVEAIRRGDLCRVAASMRNALQEPASRRTPWIDRVREAFEETTVVAHAMTGSGSCYFGLCHNRRESHRVAARLRAKRIGIVQEAVCIGG